MNHPAKVSPITPDTPPDPLDIGARLDELRQQIEEVAQ